MYRSFETTSQPSPSPPRSPAAHRPLRQPRATTITAGARSVKATLSLRRLLCKSQEVSHVGGTCWRCKERQQHSLSRRLRACSLLSPLSRYCPAKDGEGGGWAESEGRSSVTEDCNLHWDGVLLRLGRRGALRSWRRVTRTSFWRSRRAHQGFLLCWPRHLTALPQSKNRCNWTVAKVGKATGAPLMLITPNTSITNMGGILTGRSLCP